MKRIVCSAHSWNGFDDLLVVVGTLLNMSDMSVLFVLNVQCTDRVPAVFTMSETTFDGPFCPVTPHHPCEFAHVLSHQSCSSSNENKLDK